MVTSDRPAPPRSETPNEIALKMVHTPRFAFFTDNRGVVYCEQVMHNIVVLGCLGKTMGGQPTEYTSVLTFEGDEYKFLSEGRDLAERGFTIKRDMAYMNPNVWGQVKVLKEITDLAAGRKLRKVMRGGTPEAFSSGMEIELDRAVERDLINPDARPVQPFTNMVLDRLKGLSRTRSDYADMMNREMERGEQAWLDHWVKFG